MSEKNGNTVTVPAQQSDRERYRPEADRSKVYTEIEQSLGHIVSEALRQGSGFVSLASFYDRDADLVVRHEHLVDASECLEIALTYLGLLKQVLSHHIQVQDDGNPLPF